MSSRSIEKTVFVAAPVDAVWRAISDADQLAQWFPVEARVEPGVGGSIWLSWGGGMEGTAPIAHWEPNRRLGWTEARGPVTLAVDFYLEPSESGTVVRLVQSGFGTGPEWDDEFHMVKGGWGYFMEHLKWFLGPARGAHRRLVACREAVPWPRQEALARLIGPGGLSGDDALASASDGTKFATRAADAGLLSGTVVSASHATGQLALTLDQVPGGILFLEMEPHPEGTRAAFWLSIHGGGSNEFAEVERRFRALYCRALELPEPALGA